MEAFALDAARASHVHDDVLATHAATRRDVIARIERLACVFVRDAFAGTCVCEMPPKVLGLRGVARRRETRFDCARGGWVVDERIARAPQNGNDDEHVECIIRGDYVDYDDGNGARVFDEEDVA